MGDEAMDELAATSGIGRRDAYDLATSHLVEVNDNTRMASGDACRTAAREGHENKTQFATGVLFVSLENIARNLQVDRPPLWG